MGVRSIHDEMNLFHQTGGQKSSPSTPASSIRSSSKTGLAQSSCTLNSSSGLLPQPTSSFRTFSSQYSQQLPTTYSHHHHDLLLHGGSPIQPTPVFPSTTNNNNAASNATTFFNSPTLRNPNGIGSSSKRQSPLSNPNSNGIILGHGNGAPVPASNGTSFSKGSNSSMMSASFFPQESNYYAATDIFHMNHPDDRFERF